MPPEGGPLYDTALTHRSFAFERGEPAHNERLEFLGDAVLDAVVTDYIYRRFTDLPEGDLARMRAAVVNENALAGIASSLGLGEHLRLGKGEEASGGRDKPSLLSNALEAVIGAVYLDRGLEALRDHLVPLFERAIEDVLANGEITDAKSALQEHVMRQRGVLPGYTVTAEGPDHDKRFVARVSIGGAVVASGRGKSKKSAEQEAARTALAAIRGDEVGSEESDARAS